MTRESRYRQTELGTEARCGRCREFWPADADFYWMRRGKPQAYCKACYVDWLVEHGKRPGYGRGQARDDHGRTGT